MHFGTELDLLQYILEAADDPDVENIRDVYLVVNPDVSDMDEIQDSSVNAILH